MGEQKIPKIIWIFWYTGFDTAPKVIKKCVHSWKGKNPTWDIRLIDKSNLDNYIDSIDVPKEKYEKLPIQKKANLIRLKLIVEYGGVWVDATLYCMKPLDNWLHKHSPSGVFLFSNPGRDRVISNWFIAGTQSNYLINKLYQSRCRYWSTYNIPHSGFRMKKIRRLLCRVVNRNKIFPLIWLSPIFTRLFKMYPYLIFHYDFYRLVLSDRLFRKMWHNVDNISAAEPHRIQRMGMLNGVEDYHKSYLKNTNVPLFKLNYKFDEQLLSDNSLLTYLFENY